MDGLDAGVAPGEKLPVRLECMLMLIALLALLRAFGGGDFLPKLVD